MITLLILAAVVCIAAGVFLVITRGASPARFEEARRLEQAGQRRRSIAVLRDVVEDAPGNGSARWLLANLLVQQGATSDAWEVLEPLFAPGVAPRPGDNPAPGGAWPPEVSLADALAIAVRCLLSRNDGAQARRLLEEHGRPWTAAALAAPLPSSHATLDAQASPEVAAILRLQAEVATHIGEVTEAIAAWRALESWRALEPAESLDLGRLLLSQHKAEEALPLLERAKEAMPGKTEPHRLLAETLTTLGRHVDAHRLWRQLYLETSGRAKIAAGTKFAASLEDVGNPQGAVDVLEQVASLAECRPEEAAEALVQAGDLLARMKRPEEAAKRWERALERQPDHPGACRRAGREPRPDSAPGLVAYVRNLPPPAFRKMFERILADWGYTLDSVREVDRDTLHIAVSRIEGGKERRKLVYITRWENEVGQFPMQDLKLEVVEKKYDAGVFITMGNYSANAVIFASRSGIVELFSAAELLPLIEHIELPR